MGAEPAAARWGWGVLALLAAAAYAAAAATTRPFTWPADLVTAVPIAALGLGALWCWPLHPAHPACPVRPEGADASDGRRRWERAHPGAGWSILVAVVVAWELIEYFVPGSRGAHPTLSSMADAATRHAAPKAVAFWAWLCLGAVILRAGRVRTEAAAPP